MLTRKVKIKSRTGLHARPAAMLVDAANNFSAELKLVHADREANLKSIVGLMSLVIMQGDRVTIQAEGEDAEKAIKEMTTLIEENLGVKKHRNK